MHVFTIGNPKQGVLSRGDPSAVEEEGFWTALINEFLKDPNTHD